MNELQTMAAVFGLLRSDGTQQLDGAALVAAATRGMVRAADPEAGEYYDAKDFAEFRSSKPDAPVMSGLQLLRRDGRILLHPLAGGPAQQAGIQIDDILYAVNGTRIGNQEVHQVETLLEGPQGSTFFVTVFRESSLSVLTLPVERRPILDTQPRVTSVAPGIALLRVVHYRRDTLEQTAQALNKAWRQEPFRRGLVLDLRGSPGGLLTVAIGIASIFLPDNTPVASTQGKLPESNAQYKAAPAFYTRSGESDPLKALAPELRSVPMVVLMDSGTSAGAEIVAAALKDNRRAILVGQKTWGRGSIQTVRPLSGTEGVKFTTSYWLSPNGTRIHGTGITPDVAIANPNSDTAVQDAVAALGKGG